MPGPPRQRCRQCRHDKQKCILQDGADRCDRCIRRGVPCEDRSWPTPSLNNWRDLSRRPLGNPGDTDEPGRMDHDIQAPETTDSKILPTDSGYVSTLGNLKQVYNPNIPQQTSWETETVYSEASVETTRRDSITQTFADMLFKALGCGLLEALDLTTLPDLLGDFALRLGQTARSLEAKNTMVFIHRYRSEISKSLEILIGQTHGSRNEDSVKDERHKDKLLNAERLSEWLEKLDPFAPPGDQPEVADSELDKPGSDELQVSDKYADLVSKDPSYAWLLASLRNRALLTNNNKDVQETIRQTVLEVLPKTLSLRSKRVAVFQTVFEVLWPIRLFLSQQFPQLDPPDIARIVVITGDLHDCQALTCEQYVAKVWPCVGLPLLRLLQKATKTFTVKRVFCERPDGTKIEVFNTTTPSLKPTLRIRALGTRGVIAEIAEQLSWLSAAFHTSSQITPHAAGNAGKFVRCTPSISLLSTLRNEEETDRLQQGSQLRYVASQSSKLSRIEEASELQPLSYCFQISTEVQQLNYDQSIGTCWHQMIGSANMVYGFPICRRSRESLGLEIPLRVAAELIGTKYVNQFAGDSFVKGYSAMLVPTAQIDNVIVWHLYADSTGQYLSYLAHDCEAPQKIDILKIDQFRHIIGWCSEAMNYTGAADGPFRVRHANLPTATNRCVLADCGISFGKVLVSNMPYEIQRQYQTTHARAYGYSSMLTRLNQRFVLLWDKKKQRGWLVNAVRALLHLVRSSLHLEEQEAPRSVYVLKQSDLEEPEQPYSANAPYNFFGNLKNLRTKVCIKSIGTQDSHRDSSDGHDEYETLYDRVEQFYHVLDKALTYSQKLQDIGTELKKGKAASQLEGWDFFRLASAAERIDACSLPLPSFYHSWLPLVQSVGVTTLFGLGFGELIKPSSVSCCEAWDTLPTGKNYLAVNIADLQKIMDFHGDLTSNPMCISGTDLVWHDPMTAFKGCGCRELGRADTKLVQQPCSSRKKCLCVAESCAHFDLNNYRAGAVIFGRNPADAPLMAREVLERIENRELVPYQVSTENRVTDLICPSEATISPTRTETSVRSYRDGNISGGHGHWGDNNFHTSIHCNFMWPSQALQQVQDQVNQVESLHSQVGATSGSKRSRSTAQSSDRSLVTAELSRDSTEAGSSSLKRIKRGSTEPESTNDDSQCH